MRFRRGHPSAVDVARVVQQVRTELELLVPDAGLQLTGASSIPGTLSGGDIDLHVRVARGAVARTVARLSRTWTPVHRAMWTDGFATLERTVGGHPVGMAITAMDDEHGRRFVDAWSRLRHDEVALAAYESMKMAHEGAEVATYLEAKGRFFEALDRAQAEPGPIAPAEAAGRALPDGLAPAAVRGLAALGIDRLEDAARWPTDALARIDGVDHESLGLLGAAIRDRLADGR